MKKLAFHLVLRWKIIVLPTLATSRIHFLSKCWENELFFALEWKGKEPGRLRRRVRFNTRWSSKSWSGWWNALRKIDSWSFERQPFVRALHVFFFGFTACWLRDRDVYFSSASRSHSVFSWLSSQKKKTLRGRENSVAYLLGVKDAELRQMAAHLLHGHEVRGFCPVHLVHHVAFDQPLLVLFVSRQGVRPCDGIERELGSTTRCQLAPWYVIIDRGGPGR